MRIRLTERIATLKYHAKSNKRSQQIYFLQKTFILFFVIQIAAFFALPQLQTILMFQIALYLIITCYGGAFAVLPAFLGDLFGTKQLGAIHGLVLTAWACAGVAGPQLLTFLKKHYEGNYDKIFMVFVGCFIVALIISVLMLLDIKKVRGESTSSEDDFEDDTLVGEST